eukprot:COSAG04_NODE_1503_length_6511_cov_1.877573_4_plen_113_part_00
MLKQLKERYAQLRATQLDQTYVEYFAVACGYGPPKPGRSAGSLETVFIDGEPAPEVVTLPGWPTLTVPPPCSGDRCPGTTVPPKVEAICQKWSDAFLAMLKRNGGHLGPYLD